MTTLTLKMTGYRSKRSHFLTARAAARHMVKRGSGVILAFGGGGPQTLSGLGGIIETLSDNEPARVEIADSITQAALLNWTATLADVATWRLS